MNPIRLATLPLLIAAAVATAYNDPKPDTSHRGTVELGDGRIFNYSVVTNIGDKPANGADVAEAVSGEPLDPMDVLTWIYNVETHPVHTAWRHSPPDAQPEGVYLFVAVDLEIR